MGAIEHNGCSHAKYSGTILGSILGDQSEAACEES